MNIESIIVWLQFVANKDIGDFLASFFPSICHECFGKDPAFIVCNFREIILRLDDIKLIPQYIERLNQALARVFTRECSNKTEEEWMDWLRTRYIYGTGKTPLGAFVAMRLTSFHLDYPTWKEKTLRLREQLRIEAHKWSMLWEELLKASRRYGRDPSLMQAWLRLKNCLDDTLGAKIAEYGKLLTLADFADPFHYKPIQTPGFFDEEICEKVVVSDVTDAGVIKRINQDAWIVDGASPKDIYQVHLKDMCMIEEIRMQIVYALRYLPKLSIPTSTDAVVGLIRNCDISILQQMLVELDRLASIHYNVKDYQESLRRTCYLAIEEMKIRREYEERRALGLVA